jgi:hypothetical protein
MNDSGKSLSPTTKLNSAAIQRNSLHADERSPMERLEAAAQIDRQDVARLREFLWLLNVHPDLPGFEQVCRHVQQIVSLLSESFERDVRLLRLDAWLPLLSWVAKDPKELTKRLFPSKTPKYEQYRERYLRTSIPNPILRLDAKRYGLYCALWASHPDPDLQSSFRLLQARLLIAHLAVMRHVVSFGDWKRGNEPYTGFYESLYTPAWAVRRFTEPGRSWSTAIQKIDSHTTLADMPGQLRAIASEISQTQCLHDDMSETSDDTAEDPGDPGEAPGTKRKKTLEERALASIAWFIEWGLNPEEHKKITRGGGSGNPNGGGRFVGGAGDDNEATESIDDGSGEAEDIEMPLADADDRTGYTCTLHIPTQWRRNSKGYKASITAGDHPGEEHSSQPIQLAEDETGVAMAAGGAVEMANQLLPWAYGNLATAEIARLLFTLQESATQQQPELLELFALLSVMLWVGASLDQAVSLLVFNGVISDPDCDLGLRISQVDDENGTPVTEWRVRALTLPHKPENLPPAEQARERVDFFSLPDAVGGSEAVLRYLTYLRDIGNKTSAQPEAMMQNPLRIFPHEPAWYKTRIQQLFEQERYDPLGRITTTKISRVLFQTIGEQTGGDVVAAALITRSDHYLASVRRHYTTPDVSHLQQIYVAATRVLNEEFTLGGYEPCVRRCIGLAPGGTAVGSPLCPTMGAVREALRRLKSAINEASYRESWKYDPGEFIRRHNLYTFYCVLMYSFAIGVRGVRTPYLHPSDVDQDTGIATIADKDSGSGYKTRLIWLPALVLEQMRLYEIYMSGIAEGSLLKAPNSRRPCYFLRDDLKIQEVRPGTMAPFLQKYLPFPANVGRHFVCTELRERGFPPEMIDALMGHWWRGEEPWGVFSSFTFLEFRRELERVLPPFLVELGFEPIRLRYRGGAI